VSQIRHFYTAPEETLWATFAFGRLWWCHAKTEVKLLEDGTKVRDSVDGWHDTDAAGRLLDTRSLGGGILATRGFQGTIGRFGAEDALLRRIRAEQRDEVVAAQKAASELEKAVEQLISNLTWPDFEIFVDLIFRAAGYQRVSEVGGPLQRDIDLDLISPLTDEHVAVQVKATLTPRELADVVESLGRLPDYGRLYVAVHKAPEGLETTDEIVEVLTRDRLASLAVRFGLVTWLIDRVG
jgi:Restriction endonuclease